MILLAIAAVLTFAALALDGTRLAVALAVIAGALFWAWLL
jgi:hypothetical protein